MAGAAPIPFAAIAEYDFDTQCFFYSYRESVSPSGPHVKSPFLPFGVYINIVLPSSVANNSALEGESNEEVV